MGSGGVGWGRVGCGNNVHLHFLTYDAMLLCGVGWGGVGWGNNVHLHFLTYMMLRYCVGWGGVIAFICTSSHI